MGPDVEPYTTFGFFYELNLMTKIPALRLKVFIAHPSYGGNGGVSSEHPDIREWEVETALKMRADPRVESFCTATIADTPVTMVRNEFVRLAREAGCDLLLFVDSDQSPNLHKNERWFKPFWDEAFNFIYERYLKGPHVVVAPYCGPPSGVENVYVFKAQGLGNHSQETAWKLDSYSRDEASMMTGIQECAAGPTGMSLWDMRIFDLVEPVAMSKESVLDAIFAGQMTKEQALYALREGIFYYEWETQLANQKASTEDVTATRDIALAGLAKLGYNPLYCAWDSWIGHHKPWNVGKPQRYTLQNVNASYRKAVLDNVDGRERIVDLTPQGGDPLSKEIRALQAAVEAEFPATAERMNGHKGNGSVVKHEHGKLMRETNGPWFVHGGAPPEQLLALQDQVRSHGHCFRRPMRILEVGTWLGGTAIAMSDAMIGTCVHCVDTWEGSPTDCTGECAKEAGGADAVFEEFKKRIGQRLDKTIFPWRKSSLEAAAMEWQPFDIIFIDAEHTYEAAKSDILAWWKHLREDGVMIGHDYETSGCMGVTKAVKEVFGDSVETFGWDAQGAMWKVRKTDYPNMDALAEEYFRDAASVS